MDAAEIEVAFNNSDIVFSLFSPFSPARTTFKARTSGVLLVAGVGSFFAYRVASNLLGNRFVWECLDARHIDQLPTADRRLLYSFNEADEDEEDAEDQENEVDPVTGERRRRRRDSEGSRISAGQVSAKREHETEIVNKKHHKNQERKKKKPFSIGRLNRIRRSTRTPRGLLGSLQETPSKRGAGIVSRQSSRHSVASAHSVASIPFSSNSSVKSASFRIVWEGSQPTWDDFDIPSTSAGIPAITGQPSVLSRLGHVASTSSMRDGQSVGDLCSVFNDVMSVTSLAEGSDDPLLMDEDYRDEEDDESGGLLWRKCTANNTKYMYQSIAMETSEAGSDDGGSPKKRQFLDLGIDDDDEKTEQLTLLSPPDSETAMSNSKSRSMYDSAIGAEISSSEEGSTCPKRLYVLRETDNMSIAASSCASLEWCDDIDRNAASRIGFDEEKSSPLRLKRANLDWDLKSEVVPRALSVTSSSVVTREIEPKFAPKSSRDLMVMACEMFQPYSPPFRDLQTIYHRRRLKRIAIPSLPESPGSCVSLFMRSALYHKCSLLRDATWTSIEKVSSESTSSGLEPDHHRAYQVLIVLEAKRAYDERLAGLFCEDWFDVDSPADVFRILTTRGDDELPSKVKSSLLKGRDGVSIEIIDARVLSERPKIHRFSSTASPKTPSLTWLRLGKRPVPLFYIPDDE
ncbi:LOW QUALITY PROTEIN: Protein CBG11409 [Caenorhabditis briggsae]|uniref:Protein CBG11409 n=1 Tax=Caenorhabditis briggsae TaxID=6238 RepID=B0K082_CAEBR|nr:LOW QUALITY PROTEIN: Protein CBG11409 [Caenorhabditis briggsae]CAP30552.4 Protein CBG11409 [Caenorhabditis briggsae]